MLALNQNLVAFCYIQFSLILVLWDLGRKNKLPAESNGSITLDSKCYGKCKKCGHCSLNFVINFAHRVEARNNICRVYTKSNALGKWFQVIAFLGGLSPYFTWFRALLNTNGPSLAKVAYAYFDRISYKQKMGFYQYKNGPPVKPAETSFFKCLRQEGIVRPVKKASRRSPSISVYPYPKVFSDIAIQCSKGAEKGTSGSKSSPRFTRSKR